ncbi:MAG: DDE-type integrase/transposase/recombinase [Thaumarchaeota archaeon]|nr:MAG: DDE-type integrase/transposase/recombinase [Nitrososphaerota archaeon]
MTRPQLFYRNATELQLKRQVKAVNIVNDLQIKRKNKLHYKVQSQLEEGLWYDVIKRYGHNIGGHQEGEWTCNCLDFIYRHVICKHIYAVTLWKEERKTVTQDVLPPILPISNEVSNCVECKSVSIIKCGIRHNKSGNIQRYRCKECNHKFIVNIGFERSRANPKAVTVALDLYFKGVSLRKVCDHLKQFHNISVTHVSIINWISKFVDTVKPYVDSISPPHLSGVYHVDEMMVHVRREKHEVGHYQWLWNVMDNNTKFWISSIVSQRREVIDARYVYQDVKQKTTSPKAIIHDGLPSYDKAFQKEFYTLKNPRVKNIRSISVRNEGLNSVVERLNGTVRDREKVMRGMQTKETAQKILEAMRIHYNFVREHSKFGKTPASRLIH